MATVWSARDELLQRPVALKVLREQLAAIPEARRRFLHEARSGSLLDHTGIVAVHDYGETDGSAYIAFALVEGETLSARVARRLMPIPDAVRIVVEAAHALGHAHARGVIHRDVTGRNLMVATDGRVFLLDFGLALAAGQSRLTTANTALGTVTYMAPEILAGAPADTRSDLYSLGVVLYEALTGGFPFVADRHEALVYLVVHGQPRPPRELRPDLPAELERIVLWALSPEPGDRPADAERLAVALRPFAAGHVPAEPQDLPVHRAPAGADGHPPSPGPVYLAVVPFEDAPSEDGTSVVPLGPGLTETLSALLAASSTVRVIVAGHAVTRRQAIDDPRGVAAQLGANRLVSGIVRRTGSRVRVTYSVVDPATSAAVAGGTVDGTTGELFEIEDGLVRRVARDLGCELRDAPSRTRPPDPAAREHYAQALAYLQRHDDEASIDGAVRLLEHLLESEGESAPVQASLARAYLARYRLTSVRTWEGRAAAACQRALALDGEAPVTLIALGDVHAAAGRPDQAVHEYRRALAASPAAIDAWIGLARAHSAADRMADAEVAARKVIEIDRDDWRGHSLLGTIEFARGQYARAVDAWRQVVQLTPDNARGHSNLGSALFHLDRVDEALTEYRHAIQIRPHPWAYTNLGTALYFAGQPLEAADSFRRATALAPSDPLMWGNLANASRQIPGHEAEAAASADRAIALMKERLERNSVDASGWSRMAGWLAARGHRDASRQAVERALTLAPDDVLTEALAGSTYYLLGDRERALHWFEQAVRSGYGVASLLRDPELAPLRGDPEFRRILGLGPANAGT